jgi:hypothetical protein
MFDAVFATKCINRIKTFVKMFGEAKEQTPFIDLPYLECFIIAFVGVTLRPCGG